MLAVTQPRERLLGLGNGGEQRMAFRDITIRESGVTDLRGCLHRLALSS